MTHVVKLTLPDDLYETLKDYSAILGSSPSAFVRHLLLELSPSFEGVIDAVKTAEEDKQGTILKLQRLFLEGIVDSTSKVLGNDD